MSKRSAIISKARYRKRDSSGWKRCWDSSMKGNVPSASRKREATNRRLGHSRRKHTPRCARWVLIPPQDTASDVLWLTHKSMDADQQSTAQDGTPSAFHATPGSEIVNCGRCAHLNRFTRLGFGKCGCNARMRQTGEVLPTVSLDATCEHAKLSQKYNPNILREMAERNAGKWNLPPIS